MMQLHDRKPYLTNSTILRGGMLSAAGLLFAPPSMLLFNASLPMAPWWTGELLGSLLWAFIAGDCCCFTLSPMSGAARSLCVCDTIPPVSLSLS